MALHIVGHPTNGVPLDGYNTWGAFIAALTANLFPGREAADLGGGAGAQDWRLVNSSVVAETQFAARYMELRYLNDGNTEDLRLRFAITGALLGTLDPAFLLSSDPWSTGWNVDDINFASYDAGNGASIFLEGVLVTIKALAAQAGSLITNAATDREFNEDAGSFFAGMNGYLTWVVQYDPTATEHADLGFQQVQLIKTIQPDDFPAGPVIIEGGGVAGIAVVNDPTVVIQGGSQTAGWNDLSVGVADIDVSIRESFTENYVNVVTNTGDLGEPGTIVNEPAAPEVQVDVFNVPGALVPFASGGAVAWAELTTLAGIATGAIVSLGSFFHSLIASGFGSTIGVMSTSLGHLSELVPIKNAIVLSETRFLDMVTKQTAIALDLERIADELEAIRPLLEQGADPENNPNLFDTISQCCEYLKLVAETRSELTVRAKGVEVDAWTGSIVQEAP